MNQEILKLTSREKLKEKGELVSEHLCPKCGNPTETKKVGTYRCPDIKCKTEVESMKSNRKEMICPSCNGKMQRISEREIQFCESCKVNTAKLEATNSREEFKIEDTIKSTEDSVDVVLVSSRHLFRTPYSLHEKTAFASIVLEKDEIENFTPSDADPLKITQPKSFMPDCESEEARELLLEALRWGRENAPKEQVKKYEGKGIDMKGLTITENMYPPIIKILLKGIPKDGRKRALTLLLSFFTSLEFPQDFIEEKIEEWNKKNYQPLKQGYIKSQIMWSMKNKRLPPNYDKPIYKEFGIRNPPQPGMKNPINFTIKKAMQARAGTFRKKTESKKGPEI
jgi:ribosomal protein L37AE/L43A